MALESELNPYSATSLASSADSTSVSVDFAVIIRRWERLRIYYNAILVALVMLITITVFPRQVFDPSYWVHIIPGGLAANLCFLTGPAIEGYGTHFQLWHPVMTLLLFFAGLGFTIFLAIALIAAATGTF